MHDHGLQTTFRVLLDSSCTYHASHACIMAFLTLATFTTKSRACATAAAALRGFASGMQRQQYMYTVIRNFGLGWKGRGNFTNYIPLHFLEYFLGVAKILYGFQ